MKKHRENIIQRALAPTELLATAKLSKKFFILKQKFLKVILTIHWEMFLSTYQYSKKKQSFGYFSQFSCLFEPISSSLNEQKYDRHMLIQNTEEGTSVGPSGPTGFFKKENFCHYNFLILAKLMDLIGNTQNLQNKVRKIIKIHTKYLDLEKLFHIKVSKNSLFLYWISFLLSDQFYHFLKKTNAFLYKSKLQAPLGPVWGKKNKLEIQNNGNFLFLKCHDFLILKWYQNKIRAWSSQVLVKSKETIFNPKSNKISANSHITSILGKDDKVRQDYLPNETSSTHQKLIKINCFDEKKPMRASGDPLTILKISERASLENKKILSKLLKKPEDRQVLYFRLIKNIIKKSKVTNQVELIQRLNQIIGNWDTLIINNITKKKSIHLNLILYQLLWRWGIARHRKKKAKWIKNRYWSDVNNFLL